MKWLLRKRGIRKGSALTLLAFCLPVAIILAAFCINFAYMELTRTELYVAADAAARAANREQAMTGNRAVALATAKNTAGRANAVEVLAQRNASAIDGRVNMLLPNILTTKRFSASQTSRATQVEVDIAVVLDRSGSMAYSANEPAVYPPLPAAAPLGWAFGKPVPPKSRWLDAVSALDVFMTEMQASPGSELISLSTYSDLPLTNVEFTSNYSLFAPAMAAYTNKFDAGKTNIGGGIRAGINSFTRGFDRPWAAKVILVMTDGIHNTGENPISAARDAAAQKIMIFTVTFALEADQAAMKKVAQIGLGKHYHATNGNQLQSVFRDIARMIPTLITK
jgi:Ca-activated chloride channel homolog